jgi:hypothetical protein
MNRKMIRENFLKMREEENNKIKEKEAEISNQINEIKSMSNEDIYQKRMMFYEKMKVTKLDMYVEYLFDMQN